MNPARGEAALRLVGETITLRPSFSALVAAEQEIGPLFAMVERAADGRMTLAEMTGLFWHTAIDRPAALDRDRFAEAVVAGGLVHATPALKVLIGQILQGR
ncbi:Phage tail tube protein, GTA-gp10 [Sphingomonas laterariae]|uniref:Phage tail tube protein, GTA-gp10 n=1 Tax=Edaphosphingomonas laterariae TaxID=861865 RepID=A0A239C9Z5_9SPHN|nr:gene transfer agent family protein [Sphingomonas laterariae]SNS16712.1 Phage tail tube protein, GTA-gp10 [Sphingomonas laterariae]